MGNWEFLIYGIIILEYIKTRFNVMTKNVCHNNVIYASGTCHKNSNQWQSSIIVTCLRLYHVTNILHCYWREFWPRNTDIYLTYIRFGIIVTQFHVNFSRQEHQNSYMSQSTPELLKFYPTPPFIFPLQSL